MPQYLYVSFFGEGSGFGHAMRAFACARQVLALGHAIDIFLTPEEETHEDISLTSEYAVLMEMHAQLLCSPALRLVSSLDAIPNKTYDAVFLDLRKLHNGRFSLYQRYGFCIGLDLGGQARSCVPYLIDTLPNGLSKPNVYDPAGFVDETVPRRPTPPRRCTKVLLYAPQATYEQCTSIFQACAAHEIQCTFVRGTISDGQSAKGLDIGMGHVSKGGGSLANAEYSESYVATNDGVDTGVHLLPFVCDFSHRLHQYDLVITHFGLTAFEACYARVPVLLVNPSAYHARLSTKSGFQYHFRSYKRAATMLKRFATDTALFSTFAEKTIHQVNIYQRNSRQAGPRVYDRILSCAEKIRRWYGKNIPHNPFDRVRTHMPRAIWRDEDRSIFACKKTGLMFQIPFADPVSYDDAYFFRDYKAQYGKTYLEDFDDICKKMDQRLDSIGRISSALHSAPRLLDLGCAYGAMLVRARNRGFIPCGVDIHADACAYVRNTLSIPALCASVFEENFLASHEAFAHAHAQYLQGTEGTCATPPRYDVITCWYVLEHTPHFEQTLQTVWHLLAPGGIFALAVPNGRGISARKYFKCFLQANPIDHFSIFSPRPLIALLRECGFKPRALRITGNHPSRFLPPALHWLLSLPVQRMVRAFSKACRLGDTFEIYVEKPA